MHKFANSEIIDHIVIIYYWNWMKYGGALHFVFDKMATARSHGKTHSFRSENKLLKENKK